MYVCICMYLQANVIYSKLILFGACHFLSTAQNLLIHRYLFFSISPNFLLLCLSIVYRLSSNWVDKLTDEKT